MDTYISQINGRWYAFGKDGNQAISIGSDRPSGGGHWVARMCEKGILYVAVPSPSRDAAYQKARRNGEYQGEI